MTPPKSKPRLCGPFQPDPDIPPDQNGRGVCRNCHLVGAPGDAHHTLPDAPAQAEHWRRYEPTNEGD